MRGGAFAQLESASEHASVVSTDVFDTLLHRTRTAERSRIARGERRFAKLLASLGWNVSADLLLETRLRAQRLAFRGLNVGGTGEVRLTDVVALQLRVLSLPQSLLAERLQIEVDVEKESLVTNLELAAFLRARRAAGSRVVAVSDTTLSGVQLADLIDHFHGPGLVDRIYSSADYGLTKRKGGLFSAVAEAEGVALNELVHLGDDEEADVRVPRSLGVRAYHVPRVGLLKYARLADGATTEARRQLRAIRRTRAHKADDSVEKVAFAREVFGPIVTEFCLLIWLYVAQVEQTHRSVLLFCARGGIGIREAFERVLAQLDLPLQTPRKNLLVSRLVAARASLLTRSQSAIEELAREFRRDTFASVAQALGGQDYQLAEAWHRPFVARELPDLLYSRSGAAVLADIQEQNRLFERHLRAMAQGADRLILCDTGLYGSTQRLLADGFPDLNIETLQFARSNYKGHGEEHFPRVFGLLVEENFYNPLRDSSCVLRYWQLIESLFEPHLSSVRSFQEAESGGVTANCGPVEFPGLEASAFGELLNAALSFIESLPRDGGAVALAAAERAWHRLTLAVTSPSDAEVSALTVGARSVDFGRTGSIRVLSTEQAQRFSARLLSIKAQHWREGAIASGFPIAKHAFLPALSSVHVMRWLVGRRFGR